MPIDVIGGFAQLMCFVVLGTGVVLGVAVGLIYTLVQRGKK